MEKTPKILIVDDDSNLRTLITATLEKLEDYGVELLTAENGEDALKIIKAEKPNLVILDVMMPGMSGYDVCNVIKNELGMKDIFVLMLTAKGQKQDKEEGMDAGADSYMTKPFDPNEIVDKVAEVLKIDI